MISKKMLCLITLGLAVGLGLPVAAQVHHVRGMAYLA